MKSKQVLRLTEEDLYKLIKESVKMVIDESGININPKNKGKFTATKKRTGKSTEELTHSKKSFDKEEGNVCKNGKERMETS